LRGHLDDDGEAVVFCPECAEREFGARQTPTPLRLRRDTSLLTRGQESQETILTRRLGPYGTPGREVAMRRALPFLLAAACVLLIVAAATGAWFAYDARQQAQDAKKQIASLSDDIASVQDAIDSLDTSGGDGSSATVDDVESEVSDLQSSVDDLSSSLDDVASQVDNICYALTNC
jgi:hypothetical protein